MFTSVIPYTELIYWKNKVFTRLSKYLILEQIILIYANEEKMPGKESVYGHFFASSSLLSSSTHESCCSMS